MKTYQKLRKLLAANDIDQSYLARKLLRSTAYVSLCMRGKREWKLGECYQIMDLLHVPYNQLTELFPRDGIDNISDESTAQTNHSRIVEHQ